MADDAELQAWWTEILTKGHPDADPAGWPDNCKDGIKTVADLSDITTTMAYMGSAHHAAGAGGCFRVSHRLRPRVGLKVVGLSSKPTSQLDHNALGAAVLLSAQSA